MCAPVVSSPQSIQDLRTRFLAMLPKIETHGRIAFRGLKCSHQKAEVLQEMRALAWKWFVRLAQRGKDPANFITTFASFAARAVRDGRRLLGREKAKDALSPSTQQRHGFTTGSLHHDGNRRDEVLEEALHDNMQTPVPDQVVFRCDFPRWLRRQSHRNRRIIRRLMVGERTLDVAHTHALSPARIAQLRRVFREDWDRFGADSKEQSPVEGGPQSRNVAA